MNPTKEVLQIPIEDIIPNRFQPRITFDEKALSELSASIKQHGIIQPLIVRRLGEKYEIIAGERRYKAATMAGLTSVPAVVSNMNDQESAEVALIENIQRKDLTAIEEARSYKNLMEKNNMTQEEVAKKMGLSQSSVANKLRLLNLSNRVQDALLNEKISERHARALLSLANHDDQNKWLDKILDERLTVRQLDNLLKQESEEDDVPLVNINQSIDDIKSNATDIISTTKETKVKEEQETKYFSLIEDEPVRMGPTAPVQSNATSSFDIFDKENDSSKEDDILEQEEEKESNEIKLFEDVELLEIETPINHIEKLEVLNEVEEVSKDNGIGEIIKELREKIKELNVDKNINIEELDLENSYKINITIEKE